MQNNYNDKSLIFLNKQWICAISLFCIFTFMSISAFSQTKDEIILLGKNDLLQKQYAPAIQLFTNLYKTDTKDIDGIYWLSYAQTLAGNYEQADKLLKQGIQLKPDYFGFYDVYGQYFFLQNDFDNALLYFNESLKLNPANATSLNTRGMCYNYLGKYDLAFADFNSAILIDSTLAAAYNNRATARYNNQNIAKASLTDLHFALIDLNKCLMLDNNNALAYRNRGIVYFYLDSMFLAKQDLNTAVVLNSADVNAHYFLGKTLYHLDEKESALTQFNKAIQLENYKAEFYMDRGIVLTDLKQFAAARTDFYQAQQISNDFKGIANYQNARSYAAEGNKKQMIVALKAANKVKLFKKYPAIFNEIKQDEYFMKFEKDKDFYDLLQKFKFD